MQIETTKLLLRPLEETDAEGIFLLDSDPDVHEFLGKKPMKKMEEAFRVIEHIRRQYQEHGMGRLAIIDKNTNDFIGWSGLKYEQEFRKEFSYYDLGYRLRKKYWGQGIATESALAVLKYGFEKLDLEKINACAELDHFASNKILGNIGLQLTDTFDYEEVKHNWYEINKQEWQSLRANH